MSARIANIPLIVALLMLALGAGVARAATLAPDLVVARAAASPAGTHAEEDRVVQLGLPDPRTIAPGTPRRAVAEWLLAWHQRAWGRMAIWSAATLSTPAAPAALRATFGRLRLEGWALGPYGLTSAGAGAEVTLAVHRRLRVRVMSRTVSLGVRRVAGEWRVESRIPIQATPA